MLQHPTHDIDSQNIAPVLILHMITTSNIDTITFWQH